MKRTVFSHDPLVAIDIGTTKICVLVAQRTSSNSFDIVGIGQAPSHGLSKGIVVDINQTSEAIKTAAHEAELMSGCSIQSAVIGISGSHIQSINSKGIVPIARSIVSQYDIKQVIASAQAIPIAEGHQILHVLPEYFIIDDQTPVINPIGMHGIRLEAYVHIITGSITCAQNLITCCQHADIAVSDIVLEQIASGLAVLSVDERQLGVGILDIGGGTSDLALYQRGGIFYTHVLPIAGSHFTRDIALGLRISLEAAEAIKKSHGSVRPELLNYEPFTVESVEGYTHKTITDLLLYQILEPRAQELLTLINTDLEKHFLKNRIPAGIVLTGGASQLSGLQTMAEDIFSMPIRLAQPYVSKKNPTSLQNPAYATGYGLLLYHMRKEHSMFNNVHAQSLSTRIAQRMKTWVSDLF